MDLEEQKNLITVLKAYAKECVKEALKDEDLHIKQDKTPEVKTEEPKEDYDSLYSRFKL